VVATIAAGQAQMKDQRLNIRTSSEAKSLVEEAARLSHMGVSEFVLQAAVRSAEQMLADQTRVELSPEGWDEFVALLDRPARVIPALRDAAAKPNPFRER
jgi:uncharacterized protein (DUF1778 family)